MQLGHASNNLRMLDLESLNIIEWEKILVNIFVILLFVCISPLFALILDMVLYFWRLIMILYLICM